MDLTALKSMLPDMGRSNVARSTGLLLHNLSAAAVKMNTYEFVSHISSDGLLYDDPELGADIRSLLSSKFDAERAEGLKRLLALLSCGADVSSFFSDVIKIVVTQSLPVKRMAYTFLAHYSSRRPDEALMVINTLQKELGHPNAITRAHGMRAMAAMRLRAAAPVVLLAIRRTSRDPSPLVRRTAALALAAVHTLSAPPVAPLPDAYDAADPATSEGAPRRSSSSNSSSSGAPGGGPDEEVLELLDGLLGDPDPSVVGAAACSFVCICPWRLEPLGERFRALCHALHLLDEWGQAAVLELLLRYGVARFGNADRSHWLSASPEHMDAPGAPGSAAASSGGAGPSAQASGRGEGRQATSRPSASASASRGGPQPRPEDLQLALRSTRALLQSQCAGVVLGAAALQWELNAEEQEVDTHVVPALLFLLRSAPHCQQVVLTCVSSMAAACPGLFVGRVLDLVVCPGDSHPIRTHKLRLLVALAREDTVDDVMRELEDYVQDLDPWFAVHAIRAAGACALRIPRARPSTVRGLLHLLALHCGAEPAPPSAVEAGAGTGKGGGAPQAHGGSGREQQGLQGEAGVPAAGIPSRTPEAQGTGPSAVPADEAAEGSTERAGDSGACASGAPGAAPREEERGAGGGWGADSGARELEEGTAAVVLEALGALRSIVEASPQHSAEVMHLLLPRLGSIRPLRAQATAVWMLGHAARASPLLLRAAPCALHPLAARFHALTSAALKLQLLTTAAQVSLMLGEAAASGEHESATQQSPGSGASEAGEGEMLSPAAAWELSLALLGSVLAAAAVDPCIDVRDRALFLGQLLERDGLISLKSLHPQSQSQSQSLAMQQQQLQAPGDVHRWKRSLSWRAIVCEPPAVEEAGEDSAANGRTVRHPEGAAGRGKGGGNGTTSGAPSQGPRRGRFYLSSLSHCVNHLAPSYTPLPQPRSLHRGEREVSPQDGNPLEGGSDPPGMPLRGPGASGVPPSQGSVGYLEAGGTGGRSSGSGDGISAGATAEVGQVGMGRAGDASRAGANGRDSTSTQEVEAVIPQSDLESWLGSS